MKTEAPAHVFSCEFCEIFKHICFVKHRRMTASEKSERNVSNWQNMLISISRDEPKDDH